MKSFVKKILGALSPSFVTLILHGGETQVQFHGEHLADPGKALHHLSGEFRAALTLVYEKSLGQPNHWPLSGLLHDMGNWCLNGSIKNMNAFLVDNALSDVDLSMVPNLTGKTDVLDQAAEYLRLFYVAQKRDLRAAGEVPSPLDEGCLTAPRFAEFLTEHATAFSLTPQQCQTLHDAALTLDVLGP